MKRYLFLLVIILFFVTTFPTITIAQNSLVYPLVFDSSGSSANVEDDAYTSGWNGDTTNAPSQNAIYDYLHQFDTDDDGDIDSLDPNAVGAGTISSVWDDSAGDVSALTATTGDTLDASSADSSIPFKETSTPPTTEGQVCWDPNSDIQMIGTGASTVYGAKGASDGDALAGDSATSFFDVGTIEHERGGLEADVNGYSGLIAISGGSTSEIDALSELEGQIADVTAFVVEGTACSNIEGTGLSITTGTLNWACPNDSVTLTTHTAGNYVASITNGSGILGGDGGSEGATLTLAFDSNIIDASSELAAIIDDETGSGLIVFATSPSLTTPNIGTPSAGTLTNCTGLPISSGVSGLAANVATFLATPSSSNAASAVTDETGSGSLVFATSPTLVTPTLGAATATTIDTGQGAYELYAMNQNVESTDDVTFGSVTATNGLTCGAVEDPLAKFEASDPNDTDWWIGTNADAGDSSDDDFEIRTSATAGSNVFMHIDPTSGSELIDFHDYDLTSVDKLEGVDSGVYIDLGGDGVVEAVSDGTVELTAPNIKLEYDAAAYLNIATADGGATTISQTSDGTDQITIGDGGDRVDIASDSWDVTDGVITGVTSIALADAAASPDAVGEIVYENDVTGQDDGAFGWYDDDEVKYFVSIPSGSMPGDSEDDWVISYDKDTDKFYMKEDATAGSPTWDSIGNATADKAFSFDDNEITSFSFADTDEDMFTVTGTGAFGDVSVMKVSQATGDATDGTVLEVVAADANVDPLVVSSSGQANALVVGQNAGAVDVAGAFTAGTIASDATVTATTNIVIGDAGNIGSASDTDAIAIAADGVITLSQKLVTSGGVASLTPVSGSTTGFAAGFTGANLYGGTYVVTSDTGDLQLPLMAAGMNFTIIVSGAIECVAATNANDGYMLDGVDTAEDNSIVSTSTSGDIAVLQYYTADDWLITTNGWTTE